jgi:hypothetical protein
VADVRYGGIYYPEILRVLLSEKRRNWPAHTETDPSDPVIQILRLMALAGHLTAAKLDHVAAGLFPDSATLRSSFVALARRYGTRLARTSPAEAELLVEFDPWSGAEDLVAARSTFGLASRSGALVYELDSDDAVTLEDPGTFQVIVDDSAGAGITLWGLGSMTLWTAPTAGSVEPSVIYFGHASAMFQAIDVVSATPGAAFVGVWEYRDDLRALPPDSVEDLGGGSLRFLVGRLLFNGEILGSLNVSGAQVRVRSLLTGAEETASVIWSSQIARVTLSSYLGQDAPSLSVADYEVSADWIPVPDLVDGGAFLSASASVTWTLPDAEDRRWASDEVEGVSAFWVRFRVTAISGGASSPVVARSALTDGGGSWWSRFQVRQGRTRTEELGLATGEASEEFALAASDLLEVIDVTAGGSDWLEVETLLDAGAEDRAFEVRESNAGAWSVRFGDGARGRTLPGSEAVIIRYRADAATSGNVAAGTIVRDRRGNPRVRSVFNPRPAAGWVERAGMSEASILALRTELPAAWRTANRVASPSDLEAFAVKFATADGSRPFARAIAQEEGEGLGTVRLLLVGPDGRAPTAADLAELEEAANGTEAGPQRIGGVMPLNQRAVISAANLSAPVITAIAVTVLSSVSESVASERAVAAIQALLSPLALRPELLADGSTRPGTDWLWRPGASVSMALLQALALPRIPGCVGLTITGTDATLGELQLPAPLSSPPTPTVTRVGV